MRFILKSAFWLGLIAFLMPFGGEPKDTSANITTIGVFLGAQQAIADLTGFCDRAPMACDTGREIAVFAGERIGDGVAMAYALAQGRIDEHSPADSELAAAPSASDTGLPVRGPSAIDPLATGTVGAPTPGPVAYTPPKRGAVAPGDAAPMPLAVAPATIPPAPFADARKSHMAIPTPAPRG